MNTVALEVIKTPRQAVEWYDRSIAPIKAHKTTYTHESEAFVIFSEKEMGVVPNLVKEKVIFSHSGDVIYRGDIIGKHSIKIFDKNTLLEFWQEKITGYGSSLQIDARNRNVTFESYFADAICDALLGEHESERATILKHRIFENKIHLLFKESVKMLTVGRKAPSPSEAEEQYQIDYLKALFKRDFYINLDR